MLNFKERLNKVNTMIFDIDGVLTNGQVLVFDSGEVVRNVNSKDGYALQLAVKKGYNIVFISGGNNGAIKSLLNKLGIESVFISQSDKLQCYKDFIYSNNITDEQVLYMGDDLPDYEVMSRVGVAVCPMDTAPEIKSICHYISPKKGGEGCVRDIIEQVMRLQDTWGIYKW